VLVGLKIIMTIIIECSWHSDTDRLLLLINGSGSRAALSQVHSWYGVPLGSVMGPFLFVLYTADLTSVIENHGLTPLLCVLTSDDTQVYGSAVDIFTADMFECVKTATGRMRSNRLQSQSIIQTKLKSCGVRPDGVSINYRPPSDWLTASLFAWCFLLAIYTVFRKSDAKIKITITTAYLIRINYPLSSFNYRLSGTNFANFNKIHHMVSEQQLSK